MGRNLVIALKNPFNKKRELVIYPKVYKRDRPPRCTCKQKKRSRPKKERKLCFIGKLFSDKARSKKSLGDENVTRASPKGSCEASSRRSSKSVHAKDSSTSVKKLSSGLTESKYSKKKATSTEEVQRNEDAAKHSENCLASTSIKMLSGKELITDNYDKYQNTKLKNKNKPKKCKKSKKKEKHTSNEVTRDKPARRSDENETAVPIKKSWKRYKVSSFPLLDDQEREEAKPTMPTRITKKRKTPKEKLGVKEKIVKRKISTNSPSKESKVSKKPSSKIAETVQPFGKTSQNKIKEKGIMTQIYTERLSQNQPKEVDSERKSRSPKRRSIPTPHGIGGSSTKLRLREENKRTAKKTRSAAYHKKDVKIENRYKTIFQEQINQLYEELSTSEESNQKYDVDVSVKLDQTGSVTESLSHPKSHVKEDEIRETEFQKKKKETEAIKEKQASNPLQEYFQSIRNSMEIVSKLPKIRKIEPVIDEFANLKALIKSASPRSDSPVKKYPLFVMEKPGEMGDSLESAVHTKECIVPEDHDEFEEFLAKKRAINQQRIDKLQAAINELARNTEQSDKLQDPITDCKSTQEPNRVPKNAWTNTDVLSSLSDDTSRISKGILRSKDNTLGSNKDTLGTNADTPQSILENNEGTLSTSFNIRDFFVKINVFFSKNKTEEKKSVSFQGISDSASETENCTSLDESESTLEEISDTESEIDIQRKVSTERDDLPEIEGAASSIHWSDSNMDDVSSLCDTPYTKPLLQVPHGGYMYNPWIFPILAQPKYVQDFRKEWVSIWVKEQNELLAELEEAKKNAKNRPLPIPPSKRPKRKLPIPPSLRKKKDTSSSSSSKTSEDSDSSSSDSTQFSSTYETVPTNQSTVARNPSQEKAMKKSFLSTTEDLQSKTSSHNNRVRKPSKEQSKSNSTKVPQQVNSSEVEQESEKCWTPAGSVFEDDFRSNRVKEWLESQQREIDSLISQGIFKRPLPQPKIKKSFWDKLKFWKKKE